MLERVPLLDKERSASGPSAGASRQWSVSATVPFSSTRTPEIGRAHV